MSFIVHTLALFVALNASLLIVIGQNANTSTTESYKNGESVSPTAGLSNNRGRVRIGRFQCQEQTEDLERIQRQGEVKCRCPIIYAPVCGSDGETYHNRCFLNCTATHKYHRFATVPITIESWGPCTGDDSRSHSK